MWHRERERERIEKVAAICTLTSCECNALVRTVDIFTHSLTIQCGGHWPSFMYRSRLRDQLVSMDRCGARAGRQMASDEVNVRMFEKATVTGERSALLLFFCPQCVCACTKTDFTFANFLCFFSYGLGCLFLIC